MVGAYLTLFIVTTILYVIYWRSDNDKFEIAGVIVGILATIVAMIAVNTTDSSSGAYVYYINGVRASSGYMKFTSFFAMLLIFGAISNGLTRGIGYFIGHKRDAAEKAEAKGWVLVLSMIGIQFGGTLLLTGISQLVITPTPTWRHFLVVVLGIAILGWSIWGIISFIIKKCARK